MIYTTEQGFKTHVGNEFFEVYCTNEDGTTDNKAIEDINKDAVSEIELYLRGVYPLPLQEPDRIVTVLTCDIMKFRFYKKRDEANIPDNIVALYKGSLKTLEKIKSRSLVLKMPEESQTDNPVKKSRIKYTTSSRKFGAGFTGYLK
ncbi:MAG: DUF1320 domain-containing protein [Bacteroidales bacterium]|jgi:phage gp36-like protein|nr:DUF1320 domain-containing protein [Bacteroidales bacterium]